VFGAGTPDGDHLVRAGEPGARVARQRAHSGAGVAVGVEGEREDGAVLPQQRVEREPIDHLVIARRGSKLDQVSRVPAVFRSGRVGHLASLCAL
jgi:hypothetical protein